MTHLLLLLFLVPTGTPPSQAEKWRQNWLKVSENPQVKRPLAPTWHGHEEPEEEKPATLANNGKPAAGGKPAASPGGKPAATPGGKPAASPGGKPAADPKPPVTTGPRPVTPPGGKPGAVPDGKPPAGGKPAAAPDYAKMTAEQLIQALGWVVTEKGRPMASEALVGQACLGTLTRLGVPWKPGEAKKGLDTPVAIPNYMINGVFYRWYWGTDANMLLDCRMVLALFIAAPVFRKHGFDEVLYTSTYRYTRISGTRRLSRHASGNAIDVKALRGPNGAVVVVERDWHIHKGTVEDCVGPLPPGPARKMREMICEFETLPIFGGILTPESDYDHRNHFHVGNLIPGENWSRHRIAGRSIRSTRGPGYRYVPTLKYPLPKRLAPLSPWPAGVDPQAPMPTKGSLPKPEEPDPEPDPVVEDPPAEDPKPGSADPKPGSSDPKPVPTDPAPTPSDPPKPDPPPPPPPPPDDNIEDTPPPDEKP